MNREILFRGKRPDTGEWVFGWYFQKQNPYSEDGFPITHYISDLPPFFGYEVDLESVGQFTGLFDKNGKRIFEGDIVTDKWQNVCEVRFDRGEYALVRKGSLYQWIGICAADCTIIGNIHDNPELKGGGEDA